MNTIKYGAGVPTNAVKGSYYVDTNTNFMYQRVNGSWRVIRGKQILFFGAGDF